MSSGTLQNEDREGSARARAHEVVREGSRRFDDLEPPRTSALEPCKNLVSPVKM